MDTLSKQVRRAQWRLGLQRFLGVLGWFWFGALLVAVAGILFGKFGWLGMEPWLWGTAAMGGGLGAALIWIVARQRGPIEAALEIDHRCGLKERISSALILSAEELETEAGRALLQDAVRRAERLDVDEHFRVRPDRSLLLPLVPGAIALLVALFVPSLVDDSTAQAKTDGPVSEEAVKKARKSLAEKLEKQRQKAKDKGLKDAERLFKRLLEQKPEDVKEKTKSDKKKALAEFNDLAKEIEKRREKLGGADQIRNQLRQLKKVDEDGPADKLAKALSRGKFKDAMKELKKLQEDIQNGNLSEQQKAELTKQLEEMKDALDDLADAHEQAKKDLQEQLEQAEKSGSAEQASKLQQQLEKLLQQSPQMDQMNDLAKKLGQCAQCMKDGKMQDAAGKLGQLQQDLQQLSDQLGEMEMLDEALTQLDEIRDQMTCPECNGTGCKACQGLGMGGQADKPGDKPGKGMGAGRGEGFRPEKDGDAEFYNTQSPQKIGRGSATIVDMVEGPNVKGRTDLEVEADLRAVESAESDPITSQRLPRKHQQQVQEYFDNLQGKE